MYEGILMLSEVLLIEGKQEAAKLQLDEMGKRSSGLSNLQYAKYYYLTAYYHFLYDLRNQSLHQDRSKAVRAAEESLARAEKKLKIHIQSYQVIDCISQTNIHPFFEIVGKINLLKARLHLGFSSYLRSAGEQYPDNLKQVLVHLQQARIAAARDGSPNDYAYYSSFQSWIYSMLSCSDEFLTKLGLTSKSCRKWSSRLLVNAKLCYSRIGEASYNSIKLNAGRNSINNYDCGKFCIQNEVCEIEIQSMKFIQEHEGVMNSGDEKQAEDSRVQDIFCISELITTIPGGNSDKIYLFGTQSALILLSEGIQKLSELTLDGDDTNAKSAMRYFMAAWAIAEDGIVPDKTNDKNKKTIRRNFTPADFDKSGISSIRGFYPHRISHIVALSWMAIELSNILLSIRYQNFINEYQKDTFTEIEIDFNEAVYEAARAKESFALQGVNQDRFNGYMDDHLTKFKSFHAQVKNQLKMNQLGDMREIENYKRFRNRLIENWLRLLMGQETSL